MFQRAVRSLMILLMASFNVVSHADQFHYSNVLIGDRAIGLGGAFGAVADDASAVFYNPAGMAFSLSNDVSGSANALYTRKTVYKKTIASADFTENSSGSLPSFFGGLQKLDHLAQGLTMGFGIFTTDSDLKDQDDLVNSVVLGRPTACPQLDANGDAVRNNGEIVRGAERPATELERFHRTVNLRASTLTAGVAFAMRVANNLSGGIGVNYQAIDELVQEYQDVRTKISVCQRDGGYDDRTEQKTQNIRQKLAAKGLQLVLGTQYAFKDRFSLGLTLKLGGFVSQDFIQSYEDRSLALSAADQNKVKETSGEVVAGSSAIARQNENKFESPKILGTIPTEARLAVAYFASARLLLTGDAIFYGATKGEDDESGLADLYQRDAIYNLAFGLEYYLLPAIPARFGLFTNRDTRPFVDEKSTGQRDHVDYNGFSAFLAWVQPNSQVGAGFVVQQGDGKAQKIAGSTDTQLVVGQSYTFTFSATHSF